MLNKATTLKGHTALPRWGNRETYVAILTLKTGLARKASSERRFANGNALIDWVLSRPSVHIRTSRF